MRNALCECVARCGERSTRRGWARRIRGRMCGAAAEGCWSRIGGSGAVVVLRGLCCYGGAARRSAKCECDEIVVAARETSRCQAGSTAAHRRDDVVTLQRAVLSSSFVSASTLSKHASGACRNTSLCMVPPLSPPSLSLNSLSLNQMSLHPHLRPAPGAHAALARALKCSRSRSQARPARALLFSCLLLLPLPLHSASARRPPARRRPARQCLMRNLRSLGSSMRMNSS